MKITYILHGRYPTEKAYGIQVTKMCEAFSDEKVDITLIHSIFLYGPFGKVKKVIQSYKNSFDEYGRKSLFKVVGVKVPYLMFLGSIGHVFQSILFSVLVLFKDFRSIYKSDYIYTRDEVPAIFFSILGKKVIWEGHTHHGAYFSRFVLKVSNVIVVISEGLKKLLVRQGADEKKIILARDGVDLDEFNRYFEDKRSFLFSKFNLKQGTKIVLYTGHLYSWKGVDTLELSAKLLPEDIVIVCIGGTEHERMDYEKRVGAGSKIFFLENQPYNTMPDYMKASDALIIPNSGKSIISREYTSPLKLFMYMASGRPVIASDLPSIREIVDENMVTFFEPDSPGSCVSAIINSLNDSDSEKKLDLLAKEVKNYTWSNRVKYIINNLHGM